MFVKQHATWAYKQEIDKEAELEANILSSWWMCLAL